MFEVLILGMLLLGYFAISKAKEDSEESKRKYKKDMEEYEEIMKKYGYR